MVDYNISYIYYENQVRIQLLLPKSARCLKEDDRAVVKTATINSKLESKPSLSQDQVLMCSRSSQYQVQIKARLGQAGDQKTIKSFSRTSL